jgi:hypothetical protein
MSNTYTSRLLLGPSFKNELVVPNRTNRPIRHYTNCLLGSNDMRLHWENYVANNLYRYHPESYFLSLKLLSVESTTLLVPIPLRSTRSTP